MTDTILGTNVKSHYVPLQRLRSYHLQDIGIGLLLNKNELTQACTYLEFLQIPEVPKWMFIKLIAWTHYADLDFILRG